jgi:hypothetical protein
MNLFAWLRKSVAESVYAGCKDGLAMVDRDVTRCSTHAGDLTQDGLTTALGPAALPGPPLEAGTAPSVAPPLAAFVEQLRLTASTVGEGPSHENPEEARKRKPPRKDLR